jgi:hypothetical protein
MNAGNRSFLRDLQVRYFGVKGKIGGRLSYSFQTGGIVEVCRCFKSYTDRRPI